MRQYVLVARQSWLVAVLALLVCAGCQAAGSASTEWHLDPTASRPTRSATVLHVLVSVDQCGTTLKQAESASGPAITYLPDEIQIKFTAKRLSGSFSCVAMPNRSAPRTINLAQPIGSRRLIDTGQGLPGRERFPADAP